MVQASGPLEPPAAKTTLVVLLGASEYPRKPAWSNPVLGASARAFRDYARSPMGLAVVRGQVLDLFDDEAGPIDQLFRIKEFLKTTGRDTHDLILYYVGHGGFDNDDYYLGIRSTERDHEFITTIESRKLARIIRDGFGRKRVYVILDSCFAASAARDWQGEKIEAAVRQMGQPLPRHGTAFLAAASKDDVTRAPRAERYTVFTGAVLEALMRGVDRAQPRLSMYELYEEVRELLQRREADEEARPELHVPSQREGDVSLLHLFPNAAYLRIAEADRVRVAAADRAAAEAGASAAEEAAERVAARRARAESLARAEATAAARVAGEDDPPHPEHRDTEQMDAVGAAAMDAVGVATADAEGAAGLERAPTERGPTRTSAARWRLAVVGSAAILSILVAAFAIARLGGDPPPGLPEVRASSSVDARVASSAARSNAWLRVLVPATPVHLGLDSNEAPAAVRGFRPARTITSPAAPYELQEHEVTWSEIEPWLLSSHAPLAIPPWATSPEVRASLPVSGVTWSIALDYCRSLGGSLPTEEQWEYAARGPERRPNSWGADRLDPSLTHAYAGPKASPAPVTTSLQDRTPSPAIYDLIGNVQEWTLGLWREDVAGADESWAKSGPTSIRAIRGLPLGVEPPELIQPESAAYREQLCATGPCVERGAELRRYVGFRCARAATP